MNKLDKINIFKRQKKLKEKHLNLSIEQSKLDINMQNSESLTQQLDAPQVLLTDSLPFKSTVPINSLINNIYYTTLL